MANLSDPQKIAEKEKRDKRDHEIELADLKKVMSFPEGRRFIWRGLSDIYRSCYHSDSNMQSLMIGETNKSLKLMADVQEADADLYLLMQKEAINAKRGESK